MTQDTPKTNQTNNHGRDSHNHDQAVRSGMSTPSAQETAPPVSLLSRLDEPAVLEEVKAKTEAFLEEVMAQCAAERRANGGITNTQRQAYRDKRKGRSGRYNNSNFGMGF